MAKYRDAILTLYAFNTMAHRSKTFNYKKRRDAINDMERWRRRREKGKREALQQEERAQRRQDANRRERQRQKEKADKEYSKARRLHYEHLLARLRENIRKLNRMEYLDGAILFYKQRAAYRDLVDHAELYLPGKRNAEQVANLISQTEDWDEEYAEYFSFPIAEAIDSVDDSGATNGEITYHYFREALRDFRPDAWHPLDPPDLPVPNLPPEPKAMTLADVPGKPGLDAGIIASATVFVVGLLLKSPIPIVIGIAALAFFLARLPKRLKQWRGQAEAEIAEALAKAKLEHARACAEITADNARRYAVTLAEHKREREEGERKYTREHAEFQRLLVELETIRKHGLEHISRQHKIVADNPELETLLRSVAIAASSRGGKRNDGSRSLDLYTALHHVPDEFRIPVSEWDEAQLANAPRSEEAGAEEEDAPGETESPDVSAANAPDMDGADVPSDSDIGDALVLVGDDAKQAETADAKNETPHSAGPRSALRARGLRKRLDRFAAFPMRATLGDPKWIGKTMSAIASAAQPSRS